LSFVSFPHSRYHYTFDCQLFQSSVASSTAVPLSLCFSAVSISVLPYIYLYIINSWHFDLSIDIPTIMVQLAIFASVAFLSCSIFALPQSEPTPATSSGGDAVPSGTLPQSVIDSLQIIPVAGDTSGTVVQASNFSLVEARPDIVASSNSTLQKVPIRSVSINLHYYVSHTKV
jgi:hypothetical protein